MKQQTPEILNKPNMQYGYLYLVFGQLDGLFVMFISYTVYFRDQITKQDENAQTQRECGHYDQVSKIFLTLLHDSSCSYKLERK